ncbi:hypothetical protein [Spirosoma sp.]|uniref:hypothetical protein n=1 Tax=Spirosoma sp. TaxID=1899569 RepID=UPI003B3B4225
MKNNMKPEQVKENIESKDKSLDKFQRLVTTYIQQVGQYYQTNKEVQLAVKSLYRSLKRA